MATRAYEYVQQSHRQLYLCTEESCTRYAVYNVDGVKLCTNHAKDFALKTLLVEDATDGEA